MLWPRLTVFAVVMAAIVAFSRVLFVAHWLSDTVVGAAIGFLVSYPIIRGFWGVRLLDAFWKTVVDRKAGPALPAVVREEHARMDRQA